MLSKYLLKDHDQYASLLHEQISIRKQLLAIQKQELHAQGGELMSHPKGVGSAFALGMGTEFVKGRTPLPLMSLVRLGLSFF